MVIYTKNEEMEHLRKIVNKNFNTNILDKTRKKEVVQGRMAYSKILRLRGYSYEEIGLSVYRNHATIIHYVNQIEWDLKHDASFKSKYDKCSDFFLVEYDPVYNYSNIELITEIFRLRQQIKELTLDEEIQDDSYIRPEDERFSLIFKLIREKTPYGKEKEIAERINNVLNGRDISIG